MTSSLYMPHVSVDVAFNAGYATPAASRTWTDISEYVEFTEGIDIVFARQDERSEAGPNQLALTLDNKDGRFTAGLASGAYYPNVKIGRPIRVVTTFGNHHTNPSAEVNVTGWETNNLLGTNDLATSIVRSTTRAHHGSASVLATWPTTAIGTNVGHWAQIKRTNQVHTATAWVWVPTGSPDVRLVHGFSAASAYTSLKDQWVKLTLSFTPTTSSEFIYIQAATADAGDVCYVDEMMINLGDTAQDFTDTTVVESVRFLGFVDEWPVEWAETGYYASAKISATSRLSRLGDTLELTNIVQEMYLYSDPDFYWALSEPNGTLNGPEFSGGPSLMARRPLGQLLSFGSAHDPINDSGLTCVEWGTGNSSYFEAELTSQPTTALTVEMFMSSPGTTIGAGTMWTLQDADLTNNSIDCEYNYIGTLRMYIGATSQTIINAPIIDDDQTHHFAVTMTESGADVVSELFIDGVSAGTCTHAGMSIPAGMFTFRLHGWGGEPGTTNRHVAVHMRVLSDDEIASHALGGLDGFAADTPGPRITRYLTLAGIPAAETSIDAGNPTLSHIPTEGETALAVIRKVEATEGGVLFDAANGNLTFHDRDRRYSAASSFTLDATQQQIEAGFASSLDRSNLLNDVTVTSSVATSHVKDQTSIDDYGLAREQVESFALPTEEPLQAASWRVNTYKEPAARIPALAVNVTPLSMSLKASIFAASMGTRFTVTNMPSQAASSSASYFVEGYRETITPEFYGITFNVSPGSIWDVWTVEDATLGQYDAYPIAY